MKKKFKRRKYLVDKKLQTKFIINAVIVIITLFILFTLAVIYLTSTEMEGSFYKKLNLIKHGSSFITSVVLKVGIIIFIIGIIIIMIRFILFSHKIVGPMIRFRRALVDLKNGDLTTTIRFRKKDELKDIAELFSEAVQSLNFHIKGIAKEIRKLEKITKKERLNKKDIAEIKEKTKKIKELINEFKI